MGKSKKNKGEQRQALGKKVRYMGLLGATAACETCSRQHKSGILTEYDDKYFCNEVCLKIYMDSNA